MIRLVPPIAVPFGVDSLLASVVSARSGARFERALAGLCGPGVRAELFPSGRAALAAWLRAQRRPGRNEVVLPGYTCWSVAASAVRAGMRVRLADVNPETGMIDAASLARLPLDRVAAVVVAHLFARGDGADALAASARRRDGEVRVLEDSAQAWPDGAPAAADAVLLSFGRGKPLPLGGGGAVIHAGPPLAEAVGPAGGGLVQAAELGATCLLGRPLWYRLPEALPFLGIGETVFDPGFDEAGPFPAWRGALGARMLPRLEAWRHKRARHAARLVVAIGGLRGWRTVGPPVARGPLRLPVLAPGPAERSAFIAAARRRGVAAGRMYPGTLADVEALQPHLAEPGIALAGSAELADRLVTLPVHPTLTERDLADVERVVIAAAREALP